MRKPGIWVIDGSVMGAEEDIRGKSSKRQGKRKGRYKKDRIKKDHEKKQDNEKLVLSKIWLPPSIDWTKRKAERGSKRRDHLR